MATSAEETKKAMEAKSKAEVEIMFDIYAVRTPGTPDEEALEPVEPNPFPVGSIIQLEVSLPTDQLAAQEMESKPRRKSDTLSFEVIHVFWPPTMSTVYRVRKLKQKDFDTTSDDYEEAILKIFDPRLCKERAYMKNLVDKVDVFLKWTEANEQAAYRFLQSDKEPFFHPDGSFGLLDMVYQDVYRVARQVCKGNACTHWVCDKSHFKEDVPSELDVEFGTAIVDEALVLLLCEKLYRLESIAYDRLEAGSASQGTVVPKLYAKGRVRTAPLCQRTYAPHALLLEHIDGVPLTHFLTDPGRFSWLKDEDFETAENLSASKEASNDKDDTVQQSSSNVEDLLDKALPGCVKTSVYSECSSKEIKSEKKMAIRESLRMLAQALTRWSELGVAHNDLHPRNVLYVDNPKPGQGHFCVIDFNTCYIAPLSTTALSRAETGSDSALVGSDQIWEQKWSEERRLYCELDGFRACEGDDALSPNRFLQDTMSQACWECYFMEVIYSRTWKLVNVITELPFLLEEEKEVNEKPWTTYSGILGEISPPFWNSHHWNFEAIPDIPLTSIKKFLDEIWSMPEGTVVGGPCAPDTP